MEGGAPAPKPKGIQYGPRLASRMAVENSMAIHIFYRKGGVFIIMGRALGIILAASPRSHLKPFVLEGLQKIFCPYLCHNALGFA